MREGFFSLFLIIAAVLLFALLAPSDYIYYVQVLSLSGIVAMQAIGLNLLLGGTGQISLGQVGFMAVGAYSSGALLKLAGWPFAAAFGATLILVGLLGVLLGYVALRLRGHYLAMATLAFAGGIFGLLNEIEQLGGPLGMRGIPAMSIAGVPISSPSQKCVAIWTITAVATLAVASLLHSRIGRALAAIREDEIAASTLGINVARYKIAVFVIAAILSGASGSIYASYLGGLSPLRFSISESIALLIVVTVGGLGSISGSIAAAILLTALPEFLRSYENYRPTIYAAALVLLVIFFPSGIGGVLHALERGVLRLASGVTRRMALRPKGKAGA
jgi:branched-chain amino acid transport system permease protein